MPPHALLLAAGSGTRFGSQKLLALWRGQPLVAHVIAIATTLRARGLVGGVTAVVRQGDEAVGALCRQSGVRVVPNSEPQLGLSHSIRLGLGALATSPPVPDGALIFLADQPATPLDAVEEVVRAWQLGGSAVVRPRYSEAPGQPGHPVLLDRDAWGLADGLAGDHGFGAMLARSPQLVLQVDVDGANPDVDVPSDLLHLRPSRP
jgi:CTP:molybdopterin cytidylyltransferase MocA